MNLCNDTPGADRSSGIWRESGQRIDLVIAEGSSALSIGALFSPLHHLSRMPGSEGIRLVLTTIGKVELPSKDASVAQHEVAFPDLRAALKRGYRSDHTFVLSGAEVPEGVKGELTEFFRDCSRNNLHLLCIGGGLQIAAGIPPYSMDRLAVHWLKSTAFSELAPEVDLSENLFHFGNWISSCAGEAATLDFVLHFIGAEFGEGALANICDLLLVSQPRCAQTTQPGHMENRVRNLPQAVSNMARMLASDLENPAPLSCYAETQGISQRHAERLFRQHLGISPGKFRDAMRMETALRLLSETELQISEIAVATGYSTPAALSKKFKVFFGETPTRFRETRVLCSPNSRRNVIRNGPDR